MRDHEQLPQAHRAPAQRAPGPAPRGTQRDAAPRPFTPGGSPALDAASILHLQRAAGNASVVQLLGEEEERSPVHDVVGSGGSPLDEGVRTSMESAFGASFADVRVHTDDRASKSAESVGANAYTVGTDVVFRGGQFDPASPTGQRTLAHELAHVVQQAQGPVAGTDAPGGIRLSDPSDAYEQSAEESADEVMASVQRDLEPEEEEQA